MRNQTDKFFLLIDEIIIFDSFFVYLFIEMNREFVDLLIGVDVFEMDF